MRYLFLLLLMLPSALNAQVNMANLTGTTGNVQTNIDARLPISGGIGTNETFLGTTTISDLVVTNGTGPWVKLTGDTMTGPLGITGGTVTVSTPVLNLSQTWNDGAVLFVGKENNFTDTASLATSRMEDWKKGGINKFSLSKDGYPYVWGSYTDINNYRRLRISQTSGGAATIAAEGLGTGVSGNTLAFVVNAVTGLVISSAGAISSGGGFNVPAGSGIYWSSRSIMQSPADAQIMFGNNSATDADFFLKLGVNTSSACGIKRVGTVLQSRLNDDSGFATIQGKIRTDNAYVAGAPGAATGYVTITDSTGTTYKVPVLP